jgi:prolyl 4-hydroxylase
MSTTSTQQITPDLRKWIIDQAQAGYTAEVVLKSMVASGWNEDVAIEAMESTLKGHAESQAVASGLPPAVPVPEPALDESPLYLDAGDRRCVCCRPCSTRAWWCLAVCCLTRNATP